jgi:hypothetical protein
MKKSITLAALLCFGLMSAQNAFKGRGDGKFNLGLTMQEGGTGIQISSDFGLGQNLSYGFVAGYVLSGDAISQVDFIDRFDAKFRINANLGSVIKASPKFDVYPGLSLSLKNFGGHVGLRYFFTEGFGIFGEAGFPIAKYDTQASGFNNQSVFVLGASFNLN